MGEGNGTPLQYSCLENPMGGGAWWAAVHGVSKSRTWLSDLTFTIHFHALEKEMATHSSVLGWRIPGMGEPGGLPSMGSHRVRHDWSDLAAAAAAMIHNVKNLSMCLFGKIFKSPVHYKKWTAHFLFIEFWELFIYLTYKSLIRYVKVKVTQLCPTLCDPMDCSPWNSPGQNTGVGSLFLLQGIFPNPWYMFCKYFPPACILSFNFPSSVYWRVEVLTLSWSRIYDFFL